MASSSPSCPPSAVSTGVGLAGLAGLAIWVAIAFHYGMDGPSAGLTAILACGVPMILWSLLVDKVHRRDSTGIDWSSPRRVADIFDISAVKLLGLWATWGAIAFFYMTFAWYWQGPYAQVMGLLGHVGPVLVAASIPYVIWLDRYLVEPRDGAHALGLWLLNREEKPRPGAVADHVRAWAVKAFFLTFMLAVVPGNFADMIHWRDDAISGNPVALASFLIAVLFTIDVAFATVGYILTFRPLDAHIRTATPYLEGWVAALICYPPFVAMGVGGPLNYQVDTRDWAYWLGGHEALLWVWGAVLVVLTGIYAWATVAFGPRFSNLTHRGIITHGPYRLTKHPAYVAKNLFWWLSVLPFLVTSDSPATAVRNTLLLGIVSAIYYWRARTEEKHLSADPDYRAYAAWAAAHAPITRLLTGLRGRPGTNALPAARQATAEGDRA
ncbi:MAG: isoprenylcysteine carboxylmethyltransferase family protein [Sphingobium sp.]